MTTSDFITLLEGHDWYFDHSDDSRVYSKGAASQKKLLFLCQQQPELFLLYNHASACIIRGEPFNFQSVTGTPVEDEKHKHQTPTPMNTLDAAVAALLAPLIDALDRNTAAHSAKAGCVADSTPAPAADEPVKKTRAPKATPAPEPTPAEPAPAPAAPAAAAPASTTPASTAAGVSEGRLKLTVQTLAPANKVILKKYFMQKFKVQGMSELKNEAERADVHRAAIKKGAIDTFPEGEEAPAPAEEEIDIDNM